MKKKRTLLWLLLLLFSLLCIVSKAHAGLTMGDSGSCANSPTGNHVPEGPFDITPTCSEQGYEGAWFCKYCSNILSHDGIVPPMGHVWETGDLVKSATCTETGLMSTRCRYCDEQGSQQEIEALGHDWERKDTLEEPTCQAMGKSLWRCKRPDCDFEKVEEDIPLADHEWGVSADPADWIHYDCTKGGQVRLACQLCGAKGELQDSPPVGEHEWDESIIHITVESTCTEKGEGYYACSKCPAGRQPTDVPTIDHQWERKVKEAPTCTEPGETSMVCSMCGLEDPGTDEPIEPLGHRWEERVIKEPTCTEKGRVLEFCTVCDAEGEEKDIPTAEHDWEDEDKDPTCTEWGWLRGRCTVCNATQSLDIEPIDHRWEEKERMLEPTCSKPGRRRIECSMCHEEKEEEIPATGDHDWVEEVVKAPTCTEQGKDRMYCSVCGEEGAVWETYETGHDPVPIPDKPASCGEDGISGALKCSVCNEVLDEGTQEPATSQHNWAREVLVAATCQEVGKERVYCTVCGEEGEPQDIPAMEHEWKEVVLTEPTCTEAGSAFHSCAVCRAVDDIYDLPAKGHTEVILPDEAPSCEEDGVIGPRVCSTCNLILGWERRIPALGHTKGNMEMLKEPTCQEGGTAAWYCTECGQALDIEFLPVDPNAHEEVRMPGEEPTCFEPGYTELIVCNLCDKLIQQQVEIPPIPHQESEPFYSDPTCSEPGYSGMTMCVHCGVRMNDGVISAPPTNKHIWWDEIIVEPTCTERGSKRVYCNMCHIEVIKEMPATGHFWVEEDLKEPTCAQEGMCRYECIACHEKKEEVIPATGDHDWEDEDKDPTCTEWGWLRGRCTVCNATQSLDIEPIDHRWEEKERMLEPTCSKPGRRRIECSMCHEEKEEEIPATGDHDWVEEVVKAPTCTEQGKDRMYCSVCGEEGAVWETYETGHDPVPIPDKPASCGEDGISGALKCSVCNEVLNEGTQEPATGRHNWAHEVLVAATCQETGKERVYCTVCGTEGEEKDIPAINHDWVAEEVKAPTCTEPGKDRMYCSVCGEKGEAWETPETGHAPVPIPDQPASCGEDGISGALKCSVCNAMLDEGAREPATGLHNWAREVLVAATCRQAGKERVYCTMCNEEQAVNELPKINHTWANEIIYSSTCREAGKERMYCTECGFKAKSREIPPINHNWAFFPAKEPTCTEAGYTDGIKCEWCVKIIGSLPIPTIPHNRVPIPGVPPTTAETGLTEGVRCDMCNTVFVPQQVIPTVGDNSPSIYAYGGKISTVDDNTHSSIANNRNASGHHCNNDLLIVFTEADGADTSVSFCPCCRRGDKGLDITDISGATAENQPQDSILLVQRIINADGAVLLCICFEAEGKLIPVDGIVTVTLPEEALNGGTLTLPGHDTPLVLERQNGSVTVTLPFDGVAILLRLMPKN
jgi:hypothetical protein